jgi:hypothetical protein
MPDAQWHPQPRVQENGHHAHEYSQRGTGKHPAFPHAMVYSLYALSPAIACCHRRLRIRGFVEPGWANEPPKT